MTVFELQKKLNESLYKGKADHETGIDAIEFNDTTKVCKLISLKERPKAEKESVKATAPLPFKE